MRPEIQGRQRHVEFRRAAGFGPRLLKPLDRRLDFLGRAGRLRPHEQRLSVLRLFSQDQGHLPARVCWPARHEVDRAELETHVEVARVTLSRLQQVRERPSQLTEMVMREGELSDGVWVAALDPQDVRVLDDGLPKLLPSEVAIGAAQMPSLLGFRRARATG